MDYMLDFSVVFEKMPDLLLGGFGDDRSCPGRHVAGAGHRRHRGRGPQHRISVPCARLVIAFVEVVRNTPFLVQIFFIFFALPMMGMRLNPTVTAIIALAINGGAYAIEIIRGGVDSIHKGQIEAGLALGLHKAQVFRLIVLKPALRAIYPSLTSQFIMLTLTTSVCTSIAAYELTSVAQIIESDTFRSFEVYFTITLMYLVISWMMMRMFALISRTTSAIRCGEEQDHGYHRPKRNPLPAAGSEMDACCCRRSASSAAAYSGSASRLARTSARSALRKTAAGYISVFQGTPLLMQLFVVYYGIALARRQKSTPGSRWRSPSRCMPAPYLGEIWRGAIQAVPKGQTEAANALGLHYVSRMKDVILPQALQSSLPATVGFLVQLIKGTSLAAIVGFIELARAGQIVSNQTYKPLLVFGIVGAIYFVICWPLSLYGARLEHRLAKAAAVSWQSNEAQAR